MPIDFPTTTRPFGPAPSPAALSHEPLLRLIACGGPLATRRLLLDDGRHPVDAMAGGPALWRACGLSPAQIGVLQGPPSPHVAQALDWLARPGHHLIGWHDPDYPPLLRRAPGPPLALFVAGDPMLLWHPAVALVGSRSATPGGCDNAASFARALVASGLAITSGLAAGIDTAAHQSALRAGGLTVAVLGTGPDVVYPRANAALHASIASRGAIVSEHLPGTRARKEHFPSRNRILAGLSLATVVIEAAERSGALITARLASEAGREVFALPGSIHNPFARGCHRLIRDGAGLVESAQEVIAALAPMACELGDGLRRRLGAPTSVGHGNVAPNRPQPEQASDRLKDLGTGDDPNYQNLWNALGHDPMGMDQLVDRTALTPAVLSSMLLFMELEGRVATQHGRYFRKR
ncbi:MAG: DNA-protecting protein DprA [Lysobacter sp.]|nr:DNA-protecting protein DprA [Lysobacter sp.]